MATVQKNLESLILNSQNKVRVTITPAGSNDDYVINNIIDGLVTCTKGLREVMPPDINEGNLLADVREGNATPSMVDFNCKNTSETGVGSLEAILSAEGTSGVAKKNTIVVERFHGQDETAGIRWTYTNAVRANPNYSIQPGQNFDTIQCAFMSPTQPAIEEIGS